MVIGRIITLGMISSISRTYLTSRREPKRWIHKSRLLHLVDEDVWGHAHSTHANGKAEKLRDLTCKHLMESRQEEI